MPNAPILTAEAIIFAINSAIRLSRNIRKAYARSIKGKLLVLPLPDFDPSLDLITIVDFFRNNEQYLLRIKELKLLHDRAFTETSFKSDRRAFQRYQEYFHAYKLEEAPPEITLEDITHLLAVRQWQHGVEEPVSVLQIVAGTLVELGIDYFLQVPGALNPHSARGKIMREFLEAFDDIRLSTHRIKKQELSERLIPRLFAAAAESISAISDDISDDDKLQFFIRETARGIAQDLYQRLARIEDPFEQEEVIHWGQMLTRSIIKNAGTIASRHPALLFDTNLPASKIIEATGGILLDTILEDTSDKVYFKKALSTDTLDGIVQASLEVVAAHPNLISGQQGIQQIVQQVADGIREAHLFEQGYFPELLRIILEKTAGNLPLLLQTEEANGKHLLVLAMQQMLFALALPDDQAPWKPQLSQEQIIDIIYELLDEVVHNPGWLLDQTAEGTLLEQTLDVTLSSLQYVDKSARLHPDTLRWLLQLNIYTVAADKRVLNEIPWGSEEEKVVLLEKALQLIFTYIFPKDAPPHLSRIEQFIALTEYLLELIIQQHPNKKGLILLDIVLFESGIQYEEQGFDRALLDRLTDATFDALSANPSLVTNHQGLKQILAGLAASIDSASLKRPGLLLFLTELLLEQTALNTHLLIEAEEGQPAHLLLTATDIILEALTANDDSGNWQPELTDALALTLIEELLDETVRHPHWVQMRPEKHPLLQEMLDITFWVLGEVDKEERISPETLHLLIRLNTKVVLTSPQVLTIIKWGIETEQKKAILEHALHLVFSFVYNQEADPTGTRVRLLADLLDYLLSVILLHHPDQKGLILIDLVLFENNGIDYSKGLDEAQLDQLIASALEVLHQHPQLVSEQEAIRTIVGEVAATLHQSGIERPDLLPELIRLLLASTATHFYLVYEVEESDPRHLLVIATEQTLRALAQPPEQGRWKPSLSREQILEILEMVYATVLAHPQWITQEPLIFLVLEAILRALEAVPSRHLFPYDSLTHLIFHALDRASRQRELILSFPSDTGGTDEIRLRYGLREVFIVIYEEPASEEARWYLSQAEVINTLLDYYFLMIRENGASKEELDEITGRIRQAFEKWRADFSRTLEEILYELED